jgi:hypothetical protein
MKKSVWLIVGLIAVVALAFIGLAPLPGQKDNVTVHSQPSADVKPTSPTGPAHKEPNDRAPAK